MKVILAVMDYVVMIVILNTINGNICYIANYWKLYNISSFIDIYVAKEYNLVCNNGMPL